MLHVVRRNKNSVIIWAILSVVVFVFVFWGVEAVVSGPGMNSVATVGATPIEPLEVQRAEFNLVQAYRNAYKDQFTPELRASLNLRQQALEGLIDRAVLSQRADELGIEISDGELRDVILGNPSFQREGRFDKDLYVRALRYSRLTPADYEASRRRDLAIQRLQQLVQDGVTVSEDEVRDAVVSEMETRTFRFVKLPTTEFEAEVDVGDEAAVQAAYEQFKTKYAKPDRVRSSVLVFAPEVYADQVEVADEEITEIYDANKDTRFTQPHEVSARHILIKVEAGADDETKAEARARLEEIQTKVAAGEDFAALATEHSEDAGSAVKGGDLGFFGKGRMVPAFEEAAFALEPGGTSDIVESPFGFHLIRVEEVREERVKPIEEVREEIVTELQVAGGSDLAKSAADAAHEALEGGRSMEEIAAENQMVLQTPEPFAASAPIPGIGRSYPLTSALFDLEAGEHSDVSMVEKSWVVARMDERLPAETPPLEEVRSLVLGDLRRVEGEKKGKAAAEALLAQARELGSLEKAAEAAGRTIETSQALNRQGPYVPGMGVNQELKDAVFSLSDDSPLADRVFASLGDSMVVGIGEVDEPTETEIDEKLAGTRQVLLDESRQNLFRRYVAELKAETDIQVNTQLLEQLPPV